MRKSFVIAAAILVACSVAVWFTARMSRHTNAAEQTKEVAIVGEAKPAATDEFRLEFRSSKEKGGERILLRRQGFELEATRVNIGYQQKRLEATAIPEGIKVRSPGIMTVCQDLTIRPSELDSKLERLPSRQSSGNIHVNRWDKTSSSAVAWAKIDEFQCEFSRLALTGEKNRLEVTVAEGMLNVRTNDAQIRCESLLIGWREQFQLSLSATTRDAAGGEQKISVRQQ